MTNTTDWEDILIVSDRNYYDKYSFKNNWVEEKDWWNYSDVWKIIIYPLFFDIINRN